MGVSYERQVHWGPSEVESIEGLGLPKPCPGLLGEVESIEDGLLAAVMWPSCWWLDKSALQ